MGYSKTYAAALAGLLAFGLRASGIEVYDEELLNVVTSIMAIASFITVIVERKSKGGVSLLGVKEEVAVAPVKKSKKA